MAKTFIALLLFAFIASPALADVGAAKAAGHACEQSDGYLRVNSGAPADVQTLVNTVNQQRKTHYASIASKNSIAVDQVAKLTADKLNKQEPQYSCK